MHHQDDQPMYRTFEEFEREELRRADTIGATVDELFDGMLAEDLDLNATAPRQTRRRIELEGDDEE